MGGNYSEISWKPPIRQKKIQETLKISDDWNVESPFFHAIYSSKANHWLDTKFKSSWWSHTTHTNQTTGSSEQKLFQLKSLCFFQAWVMEISNHLLCFVVSCVNLLILTLSIPKCYLQYECENYNTLNAKNHHDLVLLQQSTINIQLQCNVVFKQNK